MKKRAVILIIILLVDLVSGATVSSKVILKAIENALSKYEDKEWKYINNIIVIYKSKYGSTKRYAQWIAEETKADFFESS